MRLIGHLKNESTAKTLADYLVSLDIRNLVEPDADGWAVWVYSEDQIATGQKVFSAFLENPSDRRYQVALPAPPLENPVEKPVRRTATISNKSTAWIAATGMGPVTLTLMGISVIVTLLANWPPAEPFVSKLLISQTKGGILPEIRRGEVWRLFTPIFVHFEIWHILFNMLILRDLGSLIEYRLGPKTLGWLVLILAAASNLGQYFYSGPDFFGMSGVLYGLFGYIWVRGRCEPESGLYLTPTTIGVMLIWFGLCLFDIIPNVANACHAVGLVLGMILGAAPLAQNYFRPRS